MGGWITPRPDRFTPWNDPVSIVQKAEWAPVPVSTGAENFASTGNRSKDSRNRSRTLYRLSYPGPGTVHMFTKCFKVDNSAL